MKTLVFGFAIICLTASTITMAQYAPFPSSASEERGDTAAHGGQDHADQDKEIFTGDLRKELRGTLTSSAPADASRPPNPAPSELPATATEPEATGAAPSELPATATGPETTGAASPNPALSELPATATKPETAGEATPNPALPGLAATATEPEAAGAIPPKPAASPTPMSRRVIKPRTAKRPMTMADQLKAFMRKAFKPSATKASRPKPVAGIPPRRAAPRTVRPQG